MPVTIALLAACAAPQPPAQTSAAPQRIVSLVPAVTETLFAVGAGPRVVGVGSYDAYPPEATQRPRVGGLIDPDTERILALKPDLAFLYGSQTDLIAQLSAAGIAVEQIRHGGLEDVLTSIRAIAARAGEQANGNRVAGAIQQQIDASRARTAGRPKPSVLVVFGREEGTLRGIYASGGVGFVHDMLIAAGGRNVFDDVRRESVQASLESIIQRAPDIVLEIRAPTAGSGRRPEDLTSPWRAAPTLPAVKNRKVLALIDARLVVPGPRIAEGIALIERAIWQ